MSTNVDEVGKTQNEENNDTVQTKKETEDVEIVPGYASFDDYVKNAFGALKDGIKAANSLPNGENFNYYSCFSTFNEVRSDEMKKILAVIQDLVELADVAGSMRHRDLQEQFELLVEANDVFLDRAGVCMDVEEGIAKAPGVDLIVSQTSKKNVFGSWNATLSTPETPKSNSAKGKPTLRLLAARNVQRPQLSFKDKIDNSTRPWQPRIRDKPNSLKPLALYLEQDEDGEVFSHPYEFELDKFEPPEIQLERREPKMYTTLDDTPLIVIEKPEDIQILLDDVKQYSEIAVDLEHHSYRTFQGITCLMQISTGDTDYLIDTLALRSDLHVLNEIFTKPSILKVFHGADSDIHWLQRDLSLYVVNMFDTHQAAKQLDLPYLSLAYLMKRYCNIDPNKHFQLADWRIRPLPEELMKYAREDTHYLLYIKDILCNDLIESANGQSNVLRAVYDRSTDVCKRVYRKPVWNEESYMSMYRKSQKMFNNRQLYALKELHKWRDETARLEDDSTGYVLPNHMLLNIAETLPREMQGILACCNPIPPLVRQNLLTLHKFILKAREQPLIKPVLEQDIRQRLAQRNQAVNLDVWIYAPHDTPSGTEIRPDLPCLLDAEKPMDTVQDDSTVDHVVTVFDAPTGPDTNEMDETGDTVRPLKYNAQLEETMERRRILRQKKTMFVSPFERYKRVMPMVAAQEEQERKKQQEEEAERTRTAQQEEEKTTVSIERVHEHFKNVVQNLEVKKDYDESRQDQIQVTLGQMHGRKRKRQSDVADSNDCQEDSRYDVSTPKPSLEVTVTQSYARKRKIETTDYPSPRKEMKYEPNSAGSSSQRNNSPHQGRINLNNAATGPSEKIKKLNAFGASSASRKDQKRMNRQELLKNGMLPHKHFDYKSVDFSSFQGGSTTSDVSTNFRQQKQKDKVKKGKKWKKQKIGKI